MTPILVITKILELNRTLRTKIAGKTNAIILQNEYKYSPNTVLTLSHRNIYKS